MVPQYNYIQNGYSASQSAMLLSRVAYLLSTVLLATAGAAYLGRDLPAGTGIIFGIGALICVFVLGMARKATGLNLILLYALGVLEGLSLGPLLTAYANIAGGEIISQAFALTAATVGGIGAYIWISNKDFGFLGKFLFWALLALLVVGFIGIFLPGMFAVAGSRLLFSVIGAAIFIGYTLYDFSNIKHRYGPDDYIIATVQVYLDFLNLFIFILQILGIMRSSDRD
ncbi:MAG TPA: Bax inhibitor-1 family protein [Capsulimonadaceae bacterium]|jgi:FtsH-binding integral membrane protein